MRIKFYAIVVGCAVLFSGGVCWGAENNEVPVATQNKKRVMVPANLDQKQVRPWLNSIKPAAGVRKSSRRVERKEYWQQTVNRSRKNHLSH